MRRTVEKEAHRLSSDSGFTLIELLVVLVIVGILIAVAVPSYLGFRGRAADTAGKANVRSAIHSVETYYAANDTYVGMDLTALRAIDPEIRLAAVKSVSATSYCIDAIVKGSSWNKAGPNVPITSGTCP